MEDQGGRVIERVVSDNANFPSRSIIGAEQPAYFNPL